MTAFSNLHDDSNNPPTDLDETRDFDPESEIAKVLDRHLQDLQNGIACSRQELIDKHPDIADDLVEYLDGIEMVAGLGVGSDLVPQRLGDFEIIEQIGQGAMGVVHRANQISLKRPVALKILRYAVTGKQSTKRFEREAELVATLDHPHIVPVHAFGEHESLHYFAMQLIEGESLAQWSAQADGVLKTADIPASPQQSQDSTTENKNRADSTSSTIVDRDPIKIARWVAQVARALAHAHQRDVVHRDVKPSNLLKGKDGKIWLTDFGLARRFDDVRMSMTGAMLGTPNYMSPEQAAPARHPIDHRTDIYSLGATLFELLTGRTVFLADTPHAVLAQVLAEDAPLLRDLIPGAHRDLETIVMKCLEKEPRDRYQTADDVADDLESFAAGESIRGRRPGVIEQFDRWRKQNNNTVRWAGATAAGTLTLFLVSVAAWLAWQNATTARLSIKSDQGPIVGRLIDADGNQTPTFTIPVQQPMSVTAGRYQLQTWAKHRVGQTQDMFVEAGEFKNCKIEMPDYSLFPDRTIEGIVKHWRRADGEPDGIILLQKDGIARLDASGGSEIWSIDLEQLTAPTDAELLAQQKNKDDQRARDEQSIRWEKIPLRPFDWRLGEKNIVHDANWRIASIASGFPDINDDGESDVLVGVKDHPTLVALSGKSGQRQWRYSSLPTGPSGHLNYHLETGSMNAPVVVGDIDGDGVNDVTAQFYREELRWIDAVSGRTGKKLWRIKIPETWFDPALIDKKKASTKTVVPLACQISLNGHFHRHDHWVGIDKKYYQGSLSRQPFGGFVVPWQSTLLAKKNLLLTVCGSRLIGHDSNTGEPSPSFNDGQPLELGYFPALQPQIIRNDDGEIMGLLLCEMVEQAICGVNKCKPETRFHLLSLDTAAPLWTFTTTCDPGWTGTTPDWPLIEDINGDGTPEIIVADGGDLEIEVFQDRSLICTMQAIDGNTGKAIWDQTRLPKLRCGFRQIQNVVVGPDADGDQLDDIYAVCPMVLAASRQPMSIFIDVLSGTDGHKIRSVECVCPIWHGSPDLKKPFFWGTASDGSPQLVLSSKDNSSTGSGTIFVSTQSGEVNHIADGLNVRLQMPYVAANGNVSTNKKTLFLSSPRRGQNFVGTSNLVTMKPQPQTGLNLTDVNLQPSADLDGDGASDLLNVAGSPQIIVSGSPQISANSSSDGKVLWQHSPGGSILHTTTLDADLNTDGVKDVLVWVLAAGHNQSKLTCLSGQNGQPLWVTDVECHGPLDSMHASIVPATVKGQFDLCVTLAHGAASFARDKLPYLRQLHLNGKTGRQQSNITIIGKRSFAAIPGGLFNLKANQWPMLSGDFDADGHVDTVSVAVEQDDSQTLTRWDSAGEVVWKTKLEQGKPNDRLLELRVNLIQTADNKSDLIAVASSKRTTGGKVLPFATLIRWFNVAEGKLVATWSEDVELMSGGHYRNRTHRTLHGLPFSIRDGDRGLTGICSQGDGETQSVHVLQIQDGRVKEVRRYKVSTNEMDWSWNQGASPEFLLVEDVDGNGQDEMIYFEKGDVVSKTIATDKEVARTEFPDGPSQLVGLTPDSKQIQFVRSSREVLHLHLLDLKTLKPNWTVEAPNGTNQGTFISSVRSSDDADLSSVAPPRAVFNDKKNKSSKIVYSQPSHHRKSEVAAFQPGRTNIDSVAGASIAQDKRWLKRVPWADDFEVLRLRILPKIAFGLKSLAVCLGAVVFPVWFVFQLIRRKSWSLMVTMLLPLLFVVPYMVLHFDLGYSKHSWSLLNQLGMPVFVGRICNSLYVLPAIAFCCFCVRSLWLGLWRLLAFAALFVILYGVLRGALQVLFESFTMSEGSHYQWWDWSHIILLQHGVGFVGMWVIAYMIFKQFGVKIWSRNTPVGNLLKSQLLKSQQ